jgi:hypothetical protein
LIVYPVPKWTVACDVFLLQVQPFKDDEKGFYYRILANFSWLSNKHFMRVYKGLADNLSGTPKKKRSYRGFFFFFDFIVF